MRMRNVICFCLLLSLAPASFAALTYDSTKLVYTLEPDDVKPKKKKPKSYSIDEVGPLFDRLLRRSQPPVVLFIHGRGDEPEKSLNNALGPANNAVRKIEEHGVKVVMFNWESKHGDGSDDRSLPLSKMPAAQERLGMVLDKLGQTLINLERDHITPPSITLLAHSMGTIVVQRYIEANSGSWHTPGGRRLFTNVVISSSDAESAGHAAWVDKIGAVERVFVTVNPDDKILTRSKRANPPNLKPLGMDPGTPRSSKATYVPFRMGAHEIFSHDETAPFFDAIFRGGTPPNVTTAPASPTRRAA